MRLQSTIQCTNYDMYKLSSFSRLENLKNNQLFVNLLQRKHTKIFFRGFMKILETLNDISRNNGVNSSQNKTRSSEGGVKEMII